MASVLERADGAVSGGYALVWIDPHKLTPDPANERGEINTETDPDLAGLVESIRSSGVLEPLRVYRQAGQTFINSGHRRREAALLAGCATVPCVVVQAPSHVDATVDRLVSNIQRRDINPVALAVSCKRLREAHPELSQAALASRLGMSQPALANVIRLLRLPDDVLDQIAGGRLSAGHGLQLLRIEEPWLESNYHSDGWRYTERPASEKQSELARRWVTYDVSVRSAETEVANYLDGQKWTRRRRDEEEKRKAQQAEQAGMTLEVQEAQRKEERRERIATARTDKKRARAAQAALRGSVRVWDTLEGPGGDEWLPVADVTHMRYAALALNSQYISADDRKAWGLPGEEETKGIILDMSEKGLDREGLITWCARLALPRVLRVTDDGKSLSSPMWGVRDQLLGMAEQAWGVGGRVREAVKAFDGTTLVGQARSSEDEQAEGGA